MLFGSIILIIPKGTDIHKFIGRIYALAMLVVLVTAFLTYRLYGTWGIFHWSAVISSLTLIFGLIPILLKKPINNFRSLHFSFMYWSVIGVYGAFVSETLVRMPKVVIKSGLPNGFFYIMTGIGTALVMGIGVYFFLKLKPKWERKFDAKFRQDGII